MNSLLSKIAKGVPVGHALFHTACACSARGTHHLCNFIHGILIGIQAHFWELLIIGQHLQRDIVVIADGGNGLCHCREIHIACEQVYKSADARLVEPVVGHMQLLDMLCQKLYPLFGVAKYTTFPTSRYMPTQGEPISSKKRAVSSGESRKRFHTFSMPMATPAACACGASFARAS